MKIIDRRQRGRHNAGGQKYASARSGTRVYCLEGNYPNRWTTDALILIEAEQMLNEEREFKEIYSYTYPII